MTIITFYEARKEIIREKTVHHLIVNYTSLIFNISFDLYRKYIFLLRHENDTFILS
jgi:hypothetical protein